MKYNVSVLDSGSTIAQTIAQLLSSALEQNATSIHIEPTAEVVAVRFRIDGVMQVATKLPQVHSHDLAARIKHLAKLDIDEVYRPQDGRWRVAMGDDYVDIRITTLPVEYGERVVMRIVRQLQTPPTLQQLGLWGQALRTVQQATAKTAGLVVVSSPESSGKSTTLASMMHQVSDPRVTKYAVEDEIKYRIRKTNHLQINRAVGMSPENAVDAASNQGASVIMYNAELTKKVLDKSVHAALSQKLVFLGMPSLSSTQALMDLSHAGIQPMFFASAVKTSISQRLVRRLCKSCRIKASPSKKHSEIVKNLDLPSVSKIHELESQARAKMFIAKPGKKLTKDETANLSTAKTIPKVWIANKDGCEDCNYHGYHGRIGIFEVLEKSEKLQAAVVSGKSANELQKQAVKDGMIPMAIDGFIKVLLGLTSLEELDRVK
ncbi:MAG: Flp pilus assembly complex ATPase component TadA [bacterium]|nr:Flp pilus assembly complex ATPase component TadA [bacterium]